MHTNHTQPTKRNQRTKRTQRTLGWVSIVTLGGLLLSGCSSIAGSAAQQQHASRVSAHGTADVAYAGSLQLVNDQIVGPAFVKATGIHYQGRGGGSFGVAQLIKSKEITPNVFESIGTGPVKLLDPTYTRWAIGFASSPLVLAYSPSSPFAPVLKQIADGHKPLTALFPLLEKADFHLGRTNPETDPQGQAFIFMLRLAERAYHLKPGTADKILGGVENPNQIFAEEDILSRLQAGQLDAASAFLPEAVQRHLDYIPLPAAINLGSPSEKKWYASESLRLSTGKTVKGAPLEVYITALKGNSDEQAGIAFTHYVLSPKGQAMYKREGFALTSPVVFGERSEIPASLLPLLHR